MFCVWFWIFLHWSWYVLLEGHPLLFCVAILVLFLLIKKIFFWKCVCFTMLFQFPQYRDVNQLHIHIYPFSFRFPSYLGHHRPPEKVMAPHSSTLAWKIPWVEEPGGLQSMGSRRVGHDWETSLSPFTFMHWRRKWQPTPAFLPGKSQGWGSLVGCHLWGNTESDTTEAT